MQVNTCGKNCEIFKTSITSRRSAPSQRRCLLHSVRKSTCNIWSKWEMKQIVPVFAKIRVSITVLYMVKFYLSKICIFKINLTWGLLWACLKKMCIRSVSKLNEFWTALPIFLEQTQKTKVKRSFLPPYICGMSQPPRT